MEATRLGRSPSSSLHTFRSSPYRSLRPTARPSPSHPVRHSSSHPHPARHVARSPLVTSPYGSFLARCAERKDKEPFRPQVRSLATRFLPPSPPHLFRLIPFASRRPFVSPHIPLRLTSSLHPSRYAGRPPAGKVRKGVKETRVARFLHLHVSPLFVRRSIRFIILTPTSATLRNGGRMTVGKRPK